INTNNAQKKFIFQKERAGTICMMDILLKADKKRLLMPVMKECLFMLKQELLFHSVRNYNTQVKSQPTKLHCMCTLVQTDHLHYMKMKEQIITMKKAHLPQFLLHMR